MTEPPTMLEALLRDLAPRVLGAVLRRHRDFGAAEDAVQEALLAAYVDWRDQGTPDNPGGWLYRVAMRRLADHADRERARRHREHTLAEQQSAHVVADRVDDEAEAMQQDDTLTLLFTCCHPMLTTPSAIALTLRAVGGLTTAEIARAFLVPEATMAQRISRAKQTITESQVPLSAPVERERGERLAAVMHVLYLIFNEGYATSGGSELQRVELATEAMRLTRALQRLVSDDAEVTGLLALMLLTDARRRARTGSLGELIPLDEQDRSLWDRHQIDEGTALVTAAMASGRVGPYQLQAAIAALHDHAKDHGSTDWPQILALYEVLRRLAKNPMIELNHTIAVAMVHGPAAGLKRLLALDGEPALSRSHRLHAVRAHLHEMAGETAAAVVHYRTAAAHTTNQVERHYLLNKAARLSP